MPYTLGIWFSYFQLFFLYIFLEIILSTEKYKPKNYTQKIHKNETKYKLIEFLIILLWLLVSFYSKLMRAQRAKT